MTLPSADKASRLGGALDVAQVGDTAPGHGEGPAITKTSAASGADWAWNLLRTCGVSHRWQYYSPALLQINMKLCYILREERMRHMATSRRRGTGVLDDRSVYPTLDTTGLRNRLRCFPLQCREAWDKAYAFTLPSSFRGVRGVVVAGMGGSAIGGDLLAGLAFLKSSVPISICRDYRLPSYVDEHTLVLACSYSGETEETLAAFRQALKQGAKVAAVTSGGTLAAKAMENRVPVLLVSYEGEPRTALGYGFLVPTVLLMNLGLISDMTRAFREALGVLDALLAAVGEECPASKNPAKSIAQDLLGRLPVIYGAGIFSGVARRWKTQLNENSKVWASFDLLPEANHNSVEGYSLPAHSSQHCHVVLLKPGFLHPRTELRFQVTRELLDMASIPHTTITGRGESALSQILSAVVLGDYVSYYLAILGSVSVCIRSVRTMVRHD